MAFLTLNGFTIPTAKGGTINTKDIGDPDGYAFDGTAIIDIRNRKRTWKFKTKPVNASTARMIRGLVQGNGFYFPYDSTLLSQSGRQPIAGTIGTNMLNTASDGSAPVFSYLNPADTLATKYSKFGAGSLQVDLGCTNLLSAAQSQGTGGWTGVGAGTTVTNAVAGHSWEGASSVSVVYGAGGAAQAVTNSSYAAGDVYYGSVFIGVPANWASVGQTLRVQLQGSDGSIGNSNFTDVQIQPGTWTRVGCTMTAGGSGSTVTLSVINTSGSAIGVTVYLDGAQVEKRVSGSNTYKWTAWTAGGTTRAAGNLNYAVSAASSQGFTFNCWACRPDILTANNILYLLNQNGTFTNYILAYYLSGTLNIQLNGAGITMVNAAFTWPTDDYVMLTFVVDVNALSMSIYINGNLSGIGGFAAAQAPFNGAFQNFNQLAIGGSGGITFDWGNRMDEVEVFPFPVTSAWVAARFARTATSMVSGPPLLTALGTSIDDGATGVLVQGKVTDETYLGFQDPVSAAWQSQGRVLEITLREV